ncbi:MAG: chemotaxis protein CheW [Pleurocapsa sp. CRU_1_2]|nr:chemotaxis protein CheW [Pleurocapsa sp. CRU_1_2]
MTPNFSIKSGETALFYGNAKPAPPEQPSSDSTLAQQQFLRLNISPETVALLPIKELSEVLNISTEQITPMPYMSPWIMGTHNWQGNILWLIDLGYLIGLQSLGQQVSASSYTAAILQFRFPNSNQAVGVVVNQVGNIERLNINSIQPPSLSPENKELAKLLQGYWLKSEQELLAVLKPDAIVQAISQTTN